MNKNKRWDGKLSSFHSDYLNDVLKQMAAYGNRVQFSLISKNVRPHYQVINDANKKIAFDSNNHLHHADSDEFAGANASGIHTMEQIQAAMLNDSAQSAIKSRATRTPGTKSKTSAKAPNVNELIDIEKYDFYRNNRQVLPAGIGRHTDEIGNLMRKGIPVADAFADITKRYFS